MNVPAFNNLDDANRAVRILAKEVDSLQRWKRINLGNDGITPLSTSTFYVQDISWWVPGTPMKWSQGGTTYYGMIASAAANVVTIYGPPLSTATAILAMWIGTHSPVRYEMYAPGLFAESTSNDAYYNLSGRRMQWMGRQAYLVLVTVWCSSVSGSPAINPYFGGNRILTSSLVVPDGAVTNSGVTISPTYYQVSNYAHLTYDVTTAGAGSTDLHVQLVFVEE